MSVSKNNYYYKINLILFVHLFVIHLKIFFFFWKIMYSISLSHIRIHDHFIILSLSRII